MSELHASALSWLRRVLRFADNHGLFQALTRPRQGHCALVFDTAFLCALDNQADCRIWFIWQSPEQLHEALGRQGSGFIALHGRAATVNPALAPKLRVTAVHADRDCEPTAVIRDDTVKAALRAQGMAFATCKDHVIFEKANLLPRTGQPLSDPLTSEYLTAHPSQQHFDKLARIEDRALPGLDSIGFRQPESATTGINPGMEGAATLFDDFPERLNRVHETRDSPCKWPVVAVSTSARWHDLDTHIGEGRLGTRTVRHAWHANLPRQTHRARLFRTHGRSRGDRGGDVCQIRRRPTIPSNES